MDTCLKSAQKQSEGATAIGASISEEKPRVYDGSNLSLERVKVETIENAQFEGSANDFREALGQLNARPKEEQENEIDNLLSTIRDTLYRLAGLESGTENKEMRNPSKYGGSKPSQVNKVTLENSCLSESIKHTDDVVESKILSEKLRGVKTSANNTEIAACANDQSLSTQKNALNDTSVNSVAEGSTTLSNIKVESNELNGIATQLLNLLAEEQPTEDSTVSNDAVNTPQMSLKSLSGQQSIKQERSNEGSSLAFKEEDAGRGSNTLTPALPNNLSAEVSSMVGNEILTSEPVADITSVTSNDIGIDSTDVTRDRAVQGLPRNSASVGNTVSELVASESLMNYGAQQTVTQPVASMNVGIPSNMSVITRRNTLNPSYVQPNFGIQFWNFSRGDMYPYNATQVGAPMFDVNNPFWWGKSRECTDNPLRSVVETAASNRVSDALIGNSFQPSTSSSNQLKERNRTLSEVTLGAEQDVISIESDSDDIEVITSADRSTSRRGTDTHAICSLCGEEFPNGRKDLRVHMKVAHGRYKRFKCEKCDRSFEQPHILRNHVRNVHENSGERNVPCEICDKRFKSVECLRYHIKAVHKKSENTVPCPKCGKEFVKFYLSGHLQTHRREEAYSCSVCNKKFKTKHNLMDHMKRHDETRIACEMCGKIVKKCYFSKHMKNHRHSTQCEVCGAKLSSAELLKLHMSTHTGEQPFVCEQCGRKFARQYNLRTHLKFHAGIRKLVCDLCKRTFAQKWNLRTHMESCHKSILCNGD